MSITINPIALPIAAFMPFLWGILWFHPSLLGHYWKRESIIQGKTPVIHSFSVLQLLTFYLLSFLVAFFMLNYVNHQMSVLQLFVSDPTFGEIDAASTKDFEQFMQVIGDRHLSWGHGALHGFMASVTIILPVLAHGAMRERQGFRPILIYWSYWTLSVMSMGAILGQWGVKVS